MTERDTKKPKDLVPGDVIKWNDRLALVISNEYPAGTVPSRALGYTGPKPAEDYCEPGVVLLAPRGYDLWIHTHEFTYMLLPIRKPVTVYNSVRVQQGYKRGKFLSYEERIQSSPCYSISRSCTSSLSS